MHSEKFAKCQPIKIMCNRCNDIRIAGLTPSTMRKHVDYALINKMNPGYFPLAATALKPHTNTHVSTYLR